MRRVGTFGGVLILLLQTNCASFQTVNAKNDFAPLRAKLEARNGRAAAEEINNLASECDQTIKSLATTAAGRSQAVAWLTVSGVINGIFAAIIGAAAASAGTTAEKTWYAIGSAGTAAGGAGLIVLAQAFSPSDTAKLYGSAYSHYQAAMSAASGADDSLAASGAISALEQCLGVNATPVDAKKLLLDQMLTEKPAAVAQPATVAQPAVAPTSTVTPTPPPAIH